MQLAATSLGHEYLSSAPLFRDLNFTLEPSNIYAVTGPSGSGKSTLMAILGRLITPTFGKVVRSGIEHCVWVLQNPHGVARRTVLDHVALPPLAFGSSRSEASQRAFSILDDFELAHLSAARFAELSGGEAQRVMLARAVAANPDLLLVDEPTAQLDATNAATVTGVLGQLAGRGVIVVVATHDKRVVDECRYSIELGPA